MRYIVVGLGNIGAKRRQVLGHRYVGGVDPENRDADWADLADVPPVLEAYDRHDGCGYAVWCRHCKVWHYHGHGEGHRVAHCHDPESPYHRPGYTLRPIGKTVPTYKNGRPRPPEGAG